MHLDQNAMCHDISEMKRSTLVQVLERFPSKKDSKERYEPAAEHLWSVYVGQPGQAMVVGDVVAITPEEEFVEIETKDTGARLFVTYDAIHGISDRPTTPTAERRAGFA